MRRIILIRKAGGMQFCVGRIRQNMKKNSVFQKYPIWSLLTLAIILFQVIWHISMHEPWRSLDVTMETVQTMLREGFFSNINPMTGLPYTEGVPARYKILVLPYIYASICKVTGVSPSFLLYELVPMLVLAVSYGVYCNWSVYLFPDNEKKQCVFMMLVALVYHFGDYYSVTDAFRMFHVGYEGTTIRAVILIPWVILAGLKKKWWQVAFCILAEAAMVWTLYGMGYCVLITAGFIGYRIMMRLYERRLENRRAKV